MKMKKYNAPSIAEAMKLIRADFGDDAVILNSKVVVKKKFLGLIKQKSFEVVAGIDQVEKKVTIPSLPDVDFIPSTPQVTREAAVAPATNNDQSTNDSLINADLKREIADLKAIMQSLQRHTIQSKYPDELLPFIDYLKSQELNEELITLVSDELFAHIKKGESVNLTSMRIITEQVINEKMKDLPFGGLTLNKKYINVLGPTGVGKTTTIAKIAARAVLEKKKKIGFITTDTYRIAAIEQLKTYAGLLQAPIEIVYNASDYKAAIEKLAHLDLVFIDTAGRNYKEAKYVEDLQNLIDFNSEVESLLVLSLTSKERDLETIIEQFDKIMIGKFVFTKLDETNSIGTMFNLMIKYKKGLAYYTNGQEVPEDIEEPCVDDLLELLFQGEVK